jgi:ATP-dependent 26S proteasome regulatory subunit
MSQVLKVPSQTLENYINSARNILEEKGAYRSLNVKTKVEYKDKFGQSQNLTRPCKEIVETVEALEHTIGVYFTICDVLISNKHFDGTNPSDIEFLNMFALYGGVQAGLDKLCITDSQLKTSIKEVKLDFKDKRFHEQYLNNFVEGVRKDKSIKSGEALKREAKGYLEKTIETIQSTKGKYPTMVNIVNKLDLQVNGITLQGFGRAQEQQQISNFSVNFEDLIAVDKVVGKLKKHIGNLFAYQRTKDLKFAKKVPNVILLYGPPGTGKSSLINAVGKYMKEFSENTKVGFKYKTVSEDLKSKYIGESTKNLKDAVQEVQNYQGAGLIWTDEADMLFTDDLDNDSPAEKRFLSEAMKMIEGVEKTVPNYIWIMTTNNPQKFYKPMKRRIKVQYLVEGPTTASEHSELFDMLLAEWKQEGLVKYNEQQLQQIGAYCEDLGFKGRETFNLTKLLIGDTDSVTITSNLLAKYSEKIGEYVRKHSKVVEYQDIVNKIKEVSNGLNNL